MSNNKSPLKTDKSKIQMLQAYAPAMNRDPDSEDRAIPINVTADGECSAGERIDGQVQGSSSRCGLYAGRRRGWWF